MKHYLTITDHVQNPISSFLPLLPQQEWETICDLLDDNGRERVTNQFGDIIIHLTDEEIRGLGKIYDLPCEIFLTVFHKKQVLINLKSKIN